MNKYESLKEFGTIKTYDVNECIFREGDQGNEMYIVLSGKLCVYIDSVDGHLIRISEIGAGDFFGEMSLVDDQPRSATVITTESSTVLEIKKDKFDNFVMNNPEIVFKIMKGLSRRVRHLNDELKTTRIEANKSNSENINLDIITPPLKNYSKTAPDSYEKFLFERQITCPVCFEAFITKIQRVSTLKLVKTDADFRKRYAGFEPIWYSIWVCQNCNYANFEFEFNNLPPKAIKPLRENINIIKEHPSFKFTEPRNINQVLRAYYLALHCAEIYKADNLTKGKLWLFLSWLYQDVNDMEMYEMASGKVLQYYKDAFHQSKINIPAEYLQQLCVILGELVLHKGNKREALRYFNAAVKVTGNLDINKQALQKIEQLEIKAL